MHRPQTPADDVERYREYLEQHYAEVERMIRAIARRHRLRADEAEEFASAVRLKLVDNDYAVLRKFQGRSSLLTYLTAVATRVYLDFRITQLGRWRPSAAARRHGMAAVSLQRLVERDGMTLDQACERLASDPACRQSLVQLERIYQQLPKRIRWRAVGEEALAMMPAPGTWEDGTSIALDRRLSALSDAVAALPPRDREMVSLVYYSDWAINRVAKKLDMEPRAAYRQMERVRFRLRAAVEARDAMKAAV